MRINFFSLLLLTSLVINAQQNPLFQRVNLQADDKIYDTKAWSLNTGAPVRSTPWINGQWLYFGNAKGFFYAVDKKTGNIKWKYQVSDAIHSSAIGNNGQVFFTDNHQTVYALNENSGKLLWKFDMGQKQDYPWRYDYYHASPIIHDNKLLIGGDDGFFYALHPQSGKLIWKYKCKGIIRSTANVYKNTVLFGDTEASLYALDIGTGKEIWQYRVNGDTMNNDDYGFDRRAIISSPVVSGNKVITGSRDGFLYCINADSGKSIWKVDHRVSWVISTVAIKDTFVVTGTSDGRFVQAVHLETGREIWKYNTSSAVWASPLIAGNKVYAGCFDGQLVCIDLYTGKRISQFKANNKFMSSPVWNDGLLYAGSDDGNFYAWSGHTDKRQYKDNVDRYVYYETGMNIYFKAGSDLMIRNYLRSNGYKLLGSDSLLAYMSKEQQRPSVIVFATCYFPSAVTAGGTSSILRKYLDAGGKIVMTGINPLVYQIDEKIKQAVGFRPYAADSILSLDYGKGDTRTFMGDFPSFPTVPGKQLGLPDFWTSSLFISEKNVDVILGKSENGDVSAFAKNYSNGGQFVQLWMDADKPDRLDAIIKAAEWKIE